MRARKTELKTIRRAARNWFRALENTGENRDSLEARRAELACWVRLFEEAQILMNKFDLDVGDHDLGHGVSIQVEADVLGHRAWPEVDL